MVLSLVVVAGKVVVSLAPPPGAVAGDRLGSRSDEAEPGRFPASAPATLPEERAVEKAIRENEDDPSSVGIARWGPHDLRGELPMPNGWTFNPEFLRKKPAKVRVVYRARNQYGALELRDYIYYVADGQAQGRHINVFGGAWLEILRQQRRD
jgi:hypothetical protein